MAMDERLWGDLREELIDRVLARLPIDSFFRLRAVCKRWNAIIYSQSFISDCSQVLISTCYFHWHTFYPVIANKIHLKDL